MTTAHTIQILGPLYNIVEQEQPTPLEEAHDAGLVFVAMDANAYPAFRGATLSKEWVVARALNGQVPQLDGWPNTGWRFQDEKKAREAYAKMRAHVMAKLPGVVAAEDKALERRLNDPATAIGESFSVDGEEAVYLSCDRATEARILTMLTDRLEPYTTQGAAPVRYASYSTQVAAHRVGVTQGANGLVEHLVLAFTPAEEDDLIADGLKKSVRETDLKPFNLEVPSGVLVLAWGRLDGQEMMAAAQGKPAAQYLAETVLAESLADALPSPLDASAPGPLAWAFKVRPGTYGCALRFLETENGISAMALSHLEAKPLWNDQIPRQAPVRPPAAPANPAAGAAFLQAAMAAHAQVASGAAGDPDPVVFPGEKLSKLSDYVQLMKGMQTGDLMGALSRAGLDMGAYGQIAMSWGQKMATDPTLAAKYSAMLIKA